MKAGEDTQDWLERGACLQLDISQGALVPVSGVFPNSHYRPLCPPGISRPPHKNPVLGICNSEGSGVDDRCMVPLTR